MASIRRPETVPLWGETLCLDFANTVDWTPEGEHFDPEHTDVLLTQDSLGGWARRLRLHGEDTEPAGAAELRRARALRDAVYRLFSSIGRGEEPSGADLDLLLHDYADAVAHASLLAGGDSYKLDWPERDPRRLRFAVAADAVALVQDHGRLERVSGCPGRNCGWLFLNTSGRRRWCSMTTCGSREKMRRLHHRRAGGSA